MLKLKVDEILISEMASEVDNVREYQVDGPPRSFRDSRPFERQVRISIDPFDNDHESNPYNSAAELIRQGEKRR